MCRWAAYIGDPLYIEELLVRPGHSLVDQAQNATECKTSINADGVGIAWYGTRPEPGLYRDVHPAWSDPNLQAIARQVRSSLFLCHVRASTGTATSRNNCHPFVSGRWSFMHNGQVGGFDRFRRRADFLIPDALYNDRKGATDSEVLFLLALAYGMDRDPQKALAQATRELVLLSCRYGAPPHLRLRRLLFRWEKALRGAFCDRCTGADAIPPLERGLQRQGRGVRAARGRSGRLDHRAAGQLLHIRWRARRGRTFRPSGRSGAEGLHGDGSLGTLGGRMQAPITML